MKQNQERREFSRVVIQVQVRLRTEEGNIVTGKGTRISLKGLFLETSTRLPNGSACRIEIVLGTESHRLLINVEGKVSRQEENGLGLEFTQMGSEGYEHLKNLVLYNSDEPEKAEKEFMQHLGLKART